MNSVPRAEHPRPHAIREGWQNLNGIWQFEIDNEHTGTQRGLMQVDTELSERITLPFCPESRLSGIAHTDFIYGVWYKRRISLATLSPVTMLHIGAADYKTQVYVNGISVGEHRGGYTPMCFDIARYLHLGDNELCIHCTDDTTSPCIPSGKQSERAQSYGCLYTRTTGIWQTVWLEHRPAAHIEWFKYYPNVQNSSVGVTIKLRGEGALCMQAYYDGRDVGSYTQPSASGVVTFTLPLTEQHLWELGQGRLYDVLFTFGEDRVQSYFGLREISLDGMKFKLNGRTVFGRWVLDQGFYPDGIYTAPTDEALMRDIELSMAAGFNGARLHEKIFEERFLYHADRLGYMVWGEYPDWGLDVMHPDAAYAMLPEWMEAIERDFNHPSIIGWCPHNETWNVGAQQGRRNERYDEHIKLIYRITKAMDPTRPCIDTSGGIHVLTDIYCVHDYEQNPAVFKEHYDALVTDGTLFDANIAHIAKRNGTDSATAYQAYGGEPTFVSEYGGTGWSMEDGWSYGDAPTSKEAFLARFKGLTDALLDNPCMLGLCYTQLTDVEQEQNGLYTYDRTAKFDTNTLHAILTRKASIED